MENTSENKESKLYVMKGPGYDPADDYYAPDPNAPAIEKYNPCHINHIYGLDGLQDLMEAFGSHCRCCSGARIFLLLWAFSMLMVGGTLLTTLSVIIVGCVVAAVMYGMYKDYQAFVEADRRDGE